MMGAMKVIARYQAIFCCLVLVWAVGIIIGTLFLTTWGTVSKLDQGYPDIHQLLQKRTFLNANNPKVVRALKYCSPLINAGLDQEGQAAGPENRLEAVVLMMRHGDRGPMKDFRNLSSIDCGFNANQSAEYRHYERFMQTRQGSRPPRDPFRHFAAAPGRDVCLPGQLTKWGAWQQVRTGRLLRGLYVDKLKLLEEEWRAEDVVACSTMVERTYQSAVGFLYGFLPNFDFAKINAKVGHRATFCYSPQYCVCPLADKLERAVERDKWSYVNSHPAVQSLVDHVDSVLRLRGSPASGQPDDVLDKLMVFVCHRTSLPCDPAAAADNNKCVTVEQLHNVLAFVEWRGKQLTRSDNVRLLSRLIMQGFLVDLTQRLMDVRDGRKKHKFVLYSAHDKTLMPLLTAMGVFDGMRPPFSSRLLWELYSRRGDDGTQRVYHVKIIYNGRDVTDRTSFCARKKSDPELNRICLLDTFVRFVHEDYLKELNVTNFKAACVVPAAATAAITEPSDW